MNNKNKKFYLKIVSFIFAAVMSCHDTAFALQSNSAFDEDRRNAFIKGEIRSEYAHRLEGGVQRHVTRVIEKDTVEDFVRRFEAEYSADIRQLTKDKKVYKKYFKKGEVDWEILYDVVYEREMVFCRYVIDHFVRILERARGTLEKPARIIEIDAAMLYDVDETMGTGNMDWHIRPSIIPLFKFLNDNFNVRIGIASARGYDVLKQQLQKDYKGIGHLSEIAEFIEDDLVYSIKSQQGGGGQALTDETSKWLYEMIPGHQVFDPEEVLKELGWDEDKISRFLKVEGPAIVKVKNIYDKDIAAAMGISYETGRQDKWLSKDPFGFLFSVIVSAVENCLEHGHNDFPEKYAAFIKNLGDAGITPDELTELAKMGYGYLEKKDEWEKQNRDVKEKFYKKIYKLFTGSEDGNTLYIENAVLRFAAAKDVLDRGGSYAAVSIDNIWGAEHFYKLFMGEIRDSEGRDGYTIFNLEKYRNRLFLFSTGRKGVYSISEILNDYKKRVSRRGYSRISRGQNNVDTFYVFTHLFFNINWKWLSKWEDFWRQWAKDTRHLGDEFLQEDLLMPDYIEPYYTRDTEAILIDTYLIRIHEIYETGNAVLIQNGYTVTEKDFEDMKGRMEDLGDILDANPARLDNKERMRRQKELIEMGFVANINELFVAYHAYDLLRERLIFYRDDIGNPILWGVPGRKRGYKRATIDMIREKLGNRIDNKRVRIIGAGERTAQCAEIDRRFLRTLLNIPKENVVIDAELSVDEAEEDGINGYPASWEREDARRRLTPAEYELWFARRMKQYKKEAFVWEINPFGLSSVKTYVGDVQHYKRDYDKYRFESLEQNIKQFDFEERWLLERYLIYFLIDPEKCAVMASRDFEMQQYYSWLMDEEDAAYFNLPWNAGREEVLIYWYNLLKVLFGDEINRDNIVSLITQYVEFLKDSGLKLTGKTGIDSGQVVSNFVNIERKISFRQKRIAEGFVNTVKDDLHRSQKQKIILALDTDIGNMTQLNADELLRQIKDVSNLLGNVEFVFGQGQDLTELIEGKKGELKEEDVGVVVVTKKDKKDFDDSYNIVRVDDTNLAGERGYVPILELLTFALMMDSEGDETALKEIYKEITNTELTAEIKVRIKNGDFAVPLPKAEKIPKDFYNQSVEILKSA